MDSAGVFWLFGGLWYSKIGNVEVYYWAGWVTLLAYLPLYWYRRMEDKKDKSVVAADATS